MKISVLEERINEIEGTNLFSVIELLINAVREYPIIGLDDIDSYFKEIERILGSDRIASDIIDGYILQNRHKDSEHDIWIISSLSSLLDALDLMNLYKLSFGEVRQIINEFA